MNNSKKVIAVVGPTASGKTELAIKLAERYNGEIISADSMQIYKGMNIATAKPTKEEKNGITHHLIDFLDLDEEFSVSEYTKLASKITDDVLSRGKTPLLCGGTGLYIRSFIENLQMFDESVDPKLREELNNRYKKEGGEKLINELANFDPETAAQLHPSNSKRIIRALELYLKTGLTMSEQIKKSKEIPSPYNWIVIGLCYVDRTKLYERINLRVDNMIEAGLIDEARDFYSKPKGKTAVAAIGYKELLPYFEGKCSLEESIETLKRATRRYAKRQITWFRRDKYINWIEADMVDNVFETAIEMTDKFIFAEG